MLFYPFFSTGRLFQIRRAGRRYFELLDGRGWVFDWSSWRTMWDQMMGPLGPLGIGILMDFNGDFPIKNGDFP